MNGPAAEGKMKNVRQMSGEAPSTVSATKCSGHPHKTGAVVSVLLFFSVLLCSARRVARVIDGKWLKTENVQSIGEIDVLYYVYSRIAHV